MSDLISRSKLLKEIETWGGCVEALHEYIENMPTAYDIDKVIEEIEANGKNTDVCISKIRAIEIVKQGCVSDDVCEWEIKDLCYTSSIKHYDTLPTSIVKTFANCPYCGKKIKVVE